MTYESAEPVPATRAEKRAAMKGAVRLPAQRVASAFVARADGRLSRPAAERFALLMAEGLEPPAAWRALGKKNDSGSLQYRKAIQDSPVFKVRLADLIAEKETLMQDVVFGEAKWMANQMWREARETGNATMMQKAAEMRWKIAEREADGGGREAGKPGKPAVENPQTQHAVEDLKQRLMQAGVPAPVSGGNGELINADKPNVSTFAPSEEEVEKTDSPHTQPEIDLDAMLARVG